MFGGRFRNRLCVFVCAWEGFVEMFLPVGLDIFEKAASFEEQHNFNAKERKSETECPEAVLFLITLPVRQNFG